MAPLSRMRTPRPLRQLVLLLLVVLLLSAAAQGFSCDGSCSGHGACDLTTGRCSCFPGWAGVSCKWMACPLGVAWADYASATDTAHAMAECSNMGACDRTTGVCRCLTGFEGPACDRMSCPPCANGRCLSLREVAQLQDNTNFFTSTTYDLWDADKIFGCQCDVGFTGWDCAQRVCPKGDDPLTTALVANEVQQLNCLCDGCTGSFALTFRRRTTRNLLPTETAASLKAALEALDSITQVSVFVSGASADPTTRTICDSDGATTSITFTHNPGNLPDLQLLDWLSGGTTPPALSLSTSGAPGLYDPPLVASVDGDREELDCSNRGICDYTTGICSCNVGFSSSDGAGNVGTRGDCGVGVATSCPTTSTGTCDLKGSCSGSPTWTCTCNAGFYGTDCTLRSCPVGAAWFDGATGPNAAHALAECSNKGSCNAKTGVCSCQAPFSGAACDVLSCPSSLAGVCNGHGTCRTMEQLALAAVARSGDALGVFYDNTRNNPNTWDYNKIQGCDCAAGYSYMGAYANAFGEFRDFDCGSRYCPMGDDPYESGTVNEIQSLSCLADGGAFTLTFRKQTTAAVAFDADSTALQTALQALLSITAVIVTIDGGGTALCDATTAITTQIEFTYEQGDLPPLTTSAAALTLTASTPTLAVAETRKGTKANLECSARGLCDRTSGVCQCFDYFLSSDGAGHAGTRGDCSYLSSYPTLALA